MNADKHSDTRNVWEISLAESSDPEFSFLNLKPTSWGIRPAVDAFEVCSEFLALQTPQEALRFFERCGPFQLRAKEGKDPRQWTALPVRWSEIQRAQSQFKAAQMAEWIDFKDQVHLFVFQHLEGVELSFRGIEVSEVVLSGGKPESHLKQEYAKYDPRNDPSTSKVLSPKNASQQSLSDAAIVNCEDVVTAVRAAIFLRRMNRFVWRRCARKGCDKVFEVSAGRTKKIYHSLACGHLVAVKESFARKKKEKEKKAKEDKEAKSKKKGRK